MYATSFLCASDLNQFMPRQIIHELELDDGPAQFSIDNIDEHADEHNHPVSPGQHSETASVFMPLYFSSMLHVSHIDMWKASRPMTHELVSPDDEIVHSTGRTQHIHTGCWSPSRTASIPIYHNDQLSSNLYSPSLSFSPSSSSLNKKKSGIHLLGGKLPDRSPTCLPDSSDSGSEDVYDTFVRSQVTRKIAKPMTSSRLSKIRKQLGGFEGSSAWYILSQRTTLMISLDAKARFSHS